MLYNIFLVNISRNAHIRVIVTRLTKALKNKVINLTRGGRQLATITKRVNLRAP